MGQILSKTSSLKRFILCMSLVVFPILFNSCADNFLELNKPSWLGENIYDQLKQGYKLESGENLTFNTYLRLVDDLNYSEVLKKTGSKTVFAASDDAFSRFFQSTNPWGVKSYEGLTLAQKKYLMNATMINNAYLIELMSNVKGPTEGQAMRRQTALSSLDSISVERPEAMPANKYWDIYRSNPDGIMLMKDNTSIPMVHFLQRQMDFKNITDGDFSILFNGKVRQKNDAYIYGDKVIARDITCKNGYVNVLQDVLVTPSNMAEIVRTSPETQTFSKLLERYAAPYPDPTTTNSYKTIHPDFNGQIWVKRYFSASTAPTYLGWDYKNPAAQSTSAGTLMITKDPQSNNIANTAILDFDPGWNSYVAPGSAQANSLQLDMGAMFVPTTEALTQFFETGGGFFLTQKYGSIDNIPNDIIVKLVKNHMKPSFIGSVPSKFAEVMDDSQEPMGIVKSDVVKSYVANNGAVYVINKVFAPASYVAVTAPVSVSEQMRVFNWAVNNCPTQNSNFNYYLLSMDSRYSFMVPYDQSDLPNGAVTPGLYYLNPVTLTKTQPEMWRFWYDAKATVVNATKYKYDPVLDIVGDSIGLEKGSTSPAITQPLVSCLADMLDYHIVVGDIEDGKSYYRTKGNGEIYVSGSGVGNMIIKGAGNIEHATVPMAQKIYDQTREKNGRGNGKTYTLNTPLLPSYKSVFKILQDDYISANPMYSKFFELLQGGDAYDEMYLIAHNLDASKYKKQFNVFVLKGIDYNVKFFNTFHYTVYIPTNDAMDAAFAQGLPTWNQILSMPDAQMATRDSLANQLINFLRYHFQDNSVYIDGKTDETKAYETAAFTSGTVKSYYKLYSRLTATGLTLSNSLSDLSSQSAVKVLDNDLRNKMAREYQFTAGGALETSSYAVMQPVDKVLLYSANELSEMKRLGSKSTVRAQKAYKNRK